MPSRITVVVGGQYGSEGKGAVTARLAARSDYDTVYGIRIAGPNAGHSVIDPETDRKWALRHVPVAAVTRKDATLFIAAGSEVDLAVLLSEVEALDEAGFDVGPRLYVDTTATLITENHLRREADEQLTARIGSTGKGVGAARAARIMRDAPTVENAVRTARADREHQQADPDAPAASYYGQLANALLARGVTFGPTQHYFNDAIAHENTHLIIEGTQGYGLGMHQPCYPQVTSSDCRAVDFLAMAGVSPWYRTNQQYYLPTMEVWVVLREYPIRVAGNSGPMWGETSWSALGLPEERTTVTNKVRRVGAWNPGLAADAIEANGGVQAVSVALTMADQRIPALADQSGPVSEHKNADWWPALEEHLERVAFEIGVYPSLVGTGPGTMLEVDW